MSNSLKTALFRSVGPFLLGLLLSAFVLSGMTGEANANMLAGVARVAYRDGALALCWWLGAWGLGIALTKLAIGPSVRAITSAAAGVAARDGADRTTLDELAVALGLGSALMLVLDAALGSLGLLTAGGGLMSWLPIAVGVVVGVRVLRDAPVSRDGDEGGNGTTATESTPAGIAAIACAAAIGVATGLLAVAASVAPGWLWSSEFAGYDALSYHLVLPKTWFLAGGVIAPVDGNVYSALPSYVESAFLHLMLARLNPLDGAYACQWWSALATLATAFVVARLARATLGRGAGLVACVLFLATPWTMVVGTLAYNDMYPCLSLASGWLLLRRAAGGDRRLDFRAALALTLLAAAAFGAKPSSVLFTAIPLCVLLFLHGGWRNFRFAPLVIAVGLALLAPWLVRNQLHYGNPCFPFLSKALGLGPWSQEQMDTFQAAHGNPAAGQLANLSSVWEQWLGYGFGAAPAPTEPWFPLWGLLPIVGVVGLLRDPRDKANRWALEALLVIVTMLAGWYVATHLKSRFLLPTVVPLALGAAGLLGLLARRVNAQFSAWIAVAAMLFPYLAFTREPVRGAAELRAPALLVDGMENRTGEALVTAMKDMLPSQRDEALRQADSAFLINYALPPESKFVGIGYSTPFYLVRPISWSTVWDRGEFDRVADEAPGTPGVWGARLRAQGFTHAVIDPVMLNVWARSGWLNPALASGTWVEPFVKANTLVAQTVDGKLIVSLTPPAGG